MTRTLAIAGLLVGFAAPLPPAAGQQTRLTDAHLKSAAIEIPLLIELLELEPGMTVSDLGAGFGAWTMRLSSVVGPSGRVYATEVGAAQLAALREMVERERLTNVVVVEGAENSANLPAGCCDAILIRDVYHHLTDADGIVRSVFAALKPGGRVAVIDFPPRPNSDVPSGVPANREGHGVPPQVVERELGLTLSHVKTIPEWSPDSQPPSLFLALFRKS